MKLFERLLTKLEELKALRLARTMIALALISMVGLIGYVSGLPITTWQKIIILMLSGLTALLTMIADDHASKQAYLDELRDISKKLEGEE
jgi:hypothetical protein